MTIQHEKGPIEISDKKIKAEIIKNVNDALIEFIEWHNGVFSIQFIGTLMGKMGQFAYDLIEEGKVRKANSDEIIARLQDVLAEEIEVINSTTGGRFYGDNSPASVNQDIYLYSRLTRVIRRTLEKFMSDGLL